MHRNRPFLQYLQQKTACAAFDTETRKAAMEEYFIQWMVFLQALFFPFSTILRYAINNYHLFVYNP
jgi:hypothetical protein